MKIMTLLKVACAAFVLLLGSQVASADVDSGWKGDLYGSAAVWDWYQSGSNVYSNHAAWLENHGPRAVTYSWEFKSGIPAVAGASVEKLGSGTLKSNKATFPSARPLSMSLAAKNVPRGVSFSWHLYTRMDVGAKSWRVDVYSQVFH